MGHEHHFLSRLDRVSRDHVDLALSLYRDHELLRHILSSVRLPDGADRVAISLDHPEEGPFLVVTRDGHFVTCLGAGMRPGDKPIVTRGQLDGITAKVASYRARAEMRDKLVGPGGESSRLMARIVEAGPDLSREEFVAIASVQPMLAKYFLHLVLDAAIDAEETKATLLRLLRKTKRLKPANHGLLHAYWKQFWSIGHVAMLGAMGGRELLGEVPPRSLPIESAFTLTTIRTGIGALALKGAWAIAKTGRSSLFHYKEQFVEAGSMETLVEATVALSAISLRHSKLRAEVAKALARTHPDPAYDRVRAEFAGAVEQSFERMEEALEVHRALGAGMLVERSAQIPKGSKYHFERPEDVPPALAMTYAANYADDFLTDAQRVGVLLVMLPWTARAEPEDLYLPADFLKVARVGWSPQHTLELLARSIEEDKIPASRPEGPTRSGPCPCGSGKKYKRCCGDTRDG